MKDLREKRLTKEMLAKMLSWTYDSGPDGWEISFVADSILIGATECIFRGRVCAAGGYRNGACLGTLYGKTLDELIGSCDFSCEATETQLTLDFDESECVAIVPTGNEVMMAPEKEIVTGSSVVVKEGEVPASTSPPDDLPFDIDA